MATDITLSFSRTADRAHLSVSEGKSVTLKFSETGETIPYTGDYDVTPAFGQQVLPTKHKTMTDDVTVRAIPISRTTNPAGGKTIYIGEV